MVHDLQMPSAEMIQKTAILLQQPPKLDSNPTPLHEAFWLCNHIFKENAKKSTGKAGLGISSKRIFLFTTSDLPPCPEDAQQETINSQAELHGKQLADCDIDLELFPIRAKGKLFDYSKFFSNIIAVDPDEANMMILSQTDRLSDLAARIRRREFKKKRLGRVDFRIGEGVIVGSQL